MNEHDTQSLEVEFLSGPGSLPAEPNHHDRPSDNGARSKAVGPTVEPDSYQRYWASVFPPTAIVSAKEFGRRER